MNVPPIVSSWLGYGPSGDGEIGAAAKHPSTVLSHGALVPKGAGYCVPNPHFLAFLTRKPHYDGRDVCAKQPCHRLRARRLLLAHQRQLASGAGPPASRL